MATLQPQPPNKDAPPQKEVPLVVAAPHWTPAGTPARCNEKNTAGKVLINAYFWFLLLTDWLGLTSSGHRSVAVSSSSCFSPVDSGSSSDSGLGLPWESSTGSPVSFCKEELSVSSCSFKVTSHNFVCRGFLRERLCHPLPPLCPRTSAHSFSRRKGHHRASRWPCPVWWRGQTHIPASGTTLPHPPISLCKGRGRRVASARQPSPGAPIDELGKLYLFPLLGTWHFKFERESC